MKIYIWNNPHDLKYGGSFLFVAAENEDQAREYARSAPRVPYGMSTWEDQPLGDCVLGSPTRVINTPGGECYEWEE